MFDKLEQRLNSAITKKLSNVEAVYNGVAVNLIFENTYVDQLNMSSRLPVAKLEEQYVPGISQGSIFTINSVDYRVDEIEPDGTGMMTLILAKNN
jgi:hypothetical protein